MKKVCIITPGIIASNPRVVKEAEALSLAGYQVHLIYTRHVAYLIQQDQDILDQNPNWEADYLDWTGRNLASKVIKFLSGLKTKVIHFLLRNNLYKTHSVPFLINRFYFWQLKKAIAAKADLYIAHYPESLAVAARVAQINRVPFAYDAEDFHRGEDLAKYLLKTIQITEDNLLPRASYITAASLLIGREYQKLYPLVSVRVIENMFPLKYQPAFQYLNHEPYRFFWFSQTIGPKRGLEEFIAILGQTQKQDLQLTLLGNVRKEYQHKLEKLWQLVGLPQHLLIFINTVPEKEIFTIAAQHHFGLCLEIPLVPNKDFCLSNKLYSYILAGNYLICSKTQAQTMFLKNFPEAGMLIDLQNKALSAQNILKILQCPEEIAHKRLRNYELGRTKLNYDLEKENLLRQVNKAFQNSSKEKTEIKMKKPVNIMTE